MGSIKLLFDENFGKTIIAALAALMRFHRDPPLIAHTLERFQQGTVDDVWIPQIATDGWTVFSADRARRCGGAKLPDLCAELGVTHILLTGNIHQLPQLEKMKHILFLWDDIVATSSAPKGTRFKLQLLRGRPGIVAPGDPT